MGCSMIKVTTDNGVVYLNPDHIISMFEWNGKAAIRIHGNGMTCLDVEETPGEINVKIQNAYNERTRRIAGAIFDLERTIESEMEYIRNVLRR